MMQCSLCIESGAAVQSALQYSTRGAWLTVRWRCVCVSVRAQAETVLYSTCATRYASQTKLCL